jgi:integrase
MLGTPAIHWWPGGLRVSEPVSLRWGQVIHRDSGEAQLEAVGKGDKARQVLIPTPDARPLSTSRGDAPGSAPVFGSVRRPGHPLTERRQLHLEKAFPRAPVSTRQRLAPACPCITCHRQRGPITLVSATLGHADLKKARCGDDNDDDDDAC